jgi:hypothetical protein
VRLISRSGLESTQRQEKEVMSSGSIGDGAAGNTKELRGLPEK